MENGPNMTKLGVCLVMVYLSQKKQQIVGFMSISDRSQYNIMLKESWI